MNKTEINFENYWDCLDDKFDELIKNGYVKLPSIANLDLKQISSQISSQISDKTYTELNDEHKMFIGNLLLEKKLAPKLFNFAKKNFGYKGLISNQYHVARLATPGEHKYRAHFDSHIFTLVIPLQIPTSFNKNESIGELIFFPNMRPFPKNEFIDFMGKLWTKQYSSNSGIKKLVKKKKIHINSFRDYEPLLFLGNTVFHANKPLSLNSESNRLTLLAHYFDPFPNYSIGSLLRKIRLR
tara:strand:+ start:13398 stop:14117 length:720 start_codon:yes stop_codon:yes gene_type:complete